MKKEKSDLEKWHKEYRKKHPEWKEKREARRQKELGIEDKETQSTLPKKAKCNYCDKQGTLYSSPWGIPATLHLCKFHFWILPFWPALRLHTIVFFLIIIAIIAYIFF